MYNGDINNYCGMIIYSFNVFNMAGEDITAETDGIFIYNEPATYESALQGSTYWSVTVDNSADTLLPDEVYVWALTAMFYDGVNEPTLYTTTTPFITMEKIQLFDASPYTSVVDGYLEMLDPILENHFFDFAAIFVIFFFGFIPGIMTAG